MKIIAGSGNATVYIGDKVRGGTNDHRADATVSRMGGRVRLRVVSQHFGDGRSFNFELALENADALALAAELVRVATGDTIVHER
jgi:hypothetical protein